MDITADTQDGNVIVTIPSGFTNTSEEDLEIIINIEVESDEDEYYEPEYCQPNAMDVAVQRGKSYLKKSSKRKARISNLHEEG